jgi:large subunit ribosomal protein L30
VAKIVVTWVKSTIGYGDDQRRTIKALGLKRMNGSVIHEDSATLRGMINKVRHLVKIEEKTDEAR